MAMTHHRTPAHRIVLSTAVEAVAIAAVVFAIGWGGMKWAHARQCLPVRAGSDDTIYLGMRRSHWQGDVRFIEAKWLGSWRCSGTWEISWRLAARTAGRYRVDVELSCPPDQAGGRYVVVVGGQRLEASTPDTGRWTAFHTVPVGQVALDAEPCTLRVRPAGDNHAMMVEIRSVRLVPIRAGQT